MFCQLFFCRRAEVLAFLEFTQSGAQARARATLRAFGNVGVRCGGAAHWESARTAA